MRLADVIVRCRELTKVYDLYGEEKDRLKALLGLRANVKKFPAAPRCDAGLPPQAKSSGWRG